MQKTNVFSQAIIAAVILGALSLSLVSAAFAGLLVFTLTRAISSSFLTPKAYRMSRQAKSVALIFVIFTVLVLFAGIGIASAHYLNSQEGLPWLFTDMANILDKLRISVPSGFQEYIPASVSDLKTEFVTLLRTHGEQLSGMGFETAKSSAMVLIALIAGAMLSWANLEEPSAYKPLSAALLQRFINLTDSFEKVVYAQVKISAVNTTLTALYLLVVLPAFSIHLPLAKTLVALTFAAGLLPVVGNLISNGIILTISLGVSFQLGMASLGFLIAIHKLEYFLNAKIIGQNINADAWELIIAMIVMERLFGISGIITAPILYAYLKHELTEANLIGRIAPLAKEVVQEHAGSEPDLRTAHLRRTSVQLSPGGVSDSDAIPNEATREAVAELAVITPTSIVLEPLNLEVSSEAVVEEPVATDVAVKADSPRAKHEAESAEEVFLSEEIPLEESTSHPRQKPENRWTTLRQAKQ